MKEITFDKAMKFLIASFPKIDFEPQVYWEMWKDLEDEPFMFALQAFIRSQEEIYPGTNIIAIVRNLVEGKKYPTLADAWLNVLAISKNTQDHITKYIHPLVKKASESISMWEIKQGDNIQATRAHFFKIYEQLIKRQIEDDRLAIPEADRRLLENFDDTKEIGEK